MDTDWRACPAAVDRDDALSDSTRRDGSGTGRYAAGSCDEQDGA